MEITMKDGTVLGYYGYHACDSHMTVFYIIVLHPVIYLIGQLRRALIGIHHQVRDQEELK